MLLGGIPPKVKLRNLGWRVIEKEFRPMEIQNGTAFSYSLTEDTLLFINVTTTMGYKDG